MKSKIYVQLAICLSILLSLSTTGQANIDTIIVTSNVFTPNTLTLTAGDTVTWINTLGNHNVNGTQATYPSNPETFGNSVGVGWTFTHTFTIPGNYSYQCDPHVSFGMTGTLTVQPGPDSVYINEIHYDNTGTDADEGVEIAGPAGTDLSCYDLLFYNGNDSLEDPSLTLSGTIPDLGCGYGTVWFAKSGLQNGPAEAIGLNNTCSGTLVQFLSYEGTIIALDGPAVGELSVDIGVSEPGAIGTSLQLIGTGVVYQDFTWAGPINHTRDQFNTGQIFCEGDTTIAFVGSGATVAEDTGVVTIQLSIINPSPSTAFTVDVVYSSGSATLSSDFTFATQTITFPANDSTNKTATITIIDDTIAENAEDIVLILQNPSAGITLGSDSVYTISIQGNDVVLASCSDLFYSEYVEGSSNNKAVEIYNPRSDTVDLANYTFLRRNGGSPTVNSYVYNGLLAPDDVFVVVNSGADSLALWVLGDTASVLTFFNGDDALAIVNNISGDTIDKFGEWGVDPGTNWPVDTGTSSEYTLVRKPSVQQGSIYWADGQNEWIVYAQDDFTHIGSHTMTPCAVASAVANFSSNSPVCLTDTMCFTDLSVAGGGAIASWFWSFGDGNTSTNQNPCNVYVSDGSYTVTLAVMDDSSNVDTTTATVTVTGLATVDAGLDQTVCADVTACIPLTGSIGGTSSTGVWGSTGSGTFVPNDSSLTACYIPSAADTAMGAVCLVLTSTNNSCMAISDTVCLFFTQPPKLAGTMVIDSSSCGNSDGNISGITATGVAPLTYNWVDGLSSSVGSALDLLLVASECYTLTVTDGNGCATVSGPHCVYDAGAPGTPTAGGGGTYCAGDAIADLTATGSGGTLNWFSDAALTNNIGTGSPFASGATATDTFYVAEMGSCLGLAATVIITINDLPVANFSATNVCAYDAAVFTDQSTVVSGSIVSWNWSFDDGNTSSQQNPSHLYGSDGTYNVQLITTSDNGCVDTVIQTVVIHAVPVPSFSTADICLNDVATFTDASTVSPPSLIASWSWNFGDGNVSSFQNPINTYGSSGTYNVALTVISDSGCSSTDSMAITVDPLATANAGADASICGSASATLAGTIGGSASTSLWSTSGDGTFDDATLLAATYTPGSGDITAGSVTLTLTTDDPTGSCTAATDDMVLTITAAPVASFTSTISNFTASFTDGSTGSVTSWVWDFDDGNTSISQSPSNTYSANGSYNVCLTVTSSGSCSDMVCDSVTIIAVGIDELDLAHFIEIYPNPSVDGLINLEISDESLVEGELQVLDLYGAVIIRKTITRQGTEMLNLSGQSAGIYVINIVTNRGTATKRVVIF